LKKTYICLIGFPKLDAATPGRPLSICVENWTASILMPGCGVILPSNNASITNGMAGSAVTVGVSEATGVAVNANAVTACVAVFKGCGVSVEVAVAGVGDLISKKGTVGSSNCVGCAKMTNAMPASINTPRDVKARRAREVFCSRLRKLIERLDSWRERIPIM
jgi:hypothetical protein